MHHTVYSLQNVLSRTCPYTDATSWRQLCQSLVTPGCCQVGSSVSVPAACISSACTYYATLARCYTICWLLVT